MNRLVLQLLLSTLLLKFSVASHAADPNIRWSQIETPHFIVIFDSRHEALGKLYAEFAEQAYQITVPAFGLAPKKTILVIDDSTDLANGFASGVPYSAITTFPVLPSSLESISDYGNWGLELLTHEYVHILTFEPATGLATPLRWVLGNVIRPNMYLPRWYLEGLAVELETRYSKFGRLRSANYLAIPRAMVEENTLWNEDISRINESSIPGWPGGVRPYLMGALLWNEMTRTAGDQIIGELNLAYSRRFPFLINGPVESLLGSDYVELLTKVYVRAEANAQKQIEAIQAAGKFTGEPLDQIGYFSHTPLVSPDGQKLVFIGRSHNIDSFIMLNKRTNESESFLKSKSERLTSGTSIGRVSWLPDSNSLIFNSVETHARYYQFHDLFHYDLVAKKKTRLTHGARARDPVVSPDGKSIVFVQNTPGSTRLVATELEFDNEIKKLKTRELRVLYTPPVQTRLSHPEFLSHDKIVFTEKQDDGSEKLKFLALNELGEPAGEPKEILTDFTPIHFPRLTKAGLLFASDRTGVANLYLAKVDFAKTDSQSTKLSDIRAVSNTTTRIMTGEIDPVTDELLYSRLTSDGPRLYSTQSEIWRGTPALPPTVGALVDYEWPALQPPQTEALTLESRKYSVWPHLVPRYWIPLVFAVPGGTFFQASTSASDPVGRHTYSVAGSYDTLTDQASFALGYINHTTDVPITLLAQDTYDYIYSSAISRRTTAGSVSGSFYIPGLSNDWQGALGWRYARSEFTGDSLARSGAQASLLWSNTEQKGFEISPEKGGSVRLSHTHYLPNIGDIHYDQTEFGGTYYFSKWLPERHVLALSSQAIIAPQLKQTLLGTSTIEAGYQNSLIQSGIVMRGYSSGVFLGRNLISASAEYRFPLAYTYRGLGTSPFFVRRVHADLFVDALTLDGAAYDFSVERYRRTTLGQYYFGMGAEMKIDTTVFYHVPAQIILGLYYGNDLAANPNGLYPFIGFGL